MDREQEDMQLLGLFGIYREGYKIITSWKKIFAQITLALIVPLSFIFLAHIEISNRLFWNIRYAEFRQSGNVSAQWAHYFLFKAVYFTFLLIFSLLSTSAVVYTIACIYTDRDVTFRRVMSVVPKVWKRLMVTFIIIYVAFFIYIGITVAAVILCLIIGGNAALVLFIIIIILFAGGFVYMTILWQLASVVTVLEDSYGIKAMKKSKHLIKGKIWVILFIFFKLNSILLVIQFLFWNFVANGGSLDMWKRVGIGMSCFLLLVGLILYGLVIQTIIYFVCKSYHRETIDKPSLSKHLGEYERLNKENEEVQLGQV